MGGTLFAALLGWVLGTVLQLQQAELWTVSAYLALLGLGLILAVLLAGSQAMQVFSLGLKISLLRLLLVLCAAASASYGQVGWRASIYQRSALPDLLEGVDVWVTGLIDSLPQQALPGSQADQRLTMQVESFEMLDRQGPDAVPSHQLYGADAVPHRIELSWYGDSTWNKAASEQLGTGGDELAVAVNQLMPRVGERWQLPVRLRAPHGNANPHAFDYELWLWERGIQAVGYVRLKSTLPEPRLLEQTSRYPVQQLRQRVRERIARQLQGGEQAQRLSGLLAALVLGDQTGIGSEDWGVLRDTGVAHLVAVSGLHITLFCWLAVWVIRLLWPCSTRLLGLLSTPVAALSGGVALATGYALFCGWGIPAQRTIMVLFMVAVLRLRGGQWPLPMVWLAAMAAVVTLDPWAILQAGFWLSFIAVGVLFAAGPERSSHVHLRAGEALQWGLFSRINAPYWIAAQCLAMVREQWLMMWALMPLTLILFHQMSVLGVILNLLAIPLVTLLVLPLALLGLLVPALWSVDACLLSGLLDGLVWCAAWPGATVSGAARPAVLALALLAGGLLVAFRLPAVWKLLALPWMLPFLLWTWPVPRTGEFQVVALDVGQGQAVLIQTANHALLYDAGPLYGRPGQTVMDAGRRVVVPYLQARGIRLDRLLLSHGDTDHTGGAAAVLHHYPHAEWMGSVPPEHELHELRPGMPCTAGQRWEWDGVSFQVLYPLHSNEQAQRKTPNTQSCVLRVANERVAVLLPGDIGAPEERQLLAHWPKEIPLKINGLMMPHHGSRYSSSHELLAALHPDWVMAQTGYRNRFGHPHAQVVARYKQLGTEVYESPRCGAWHWSSGKPRHSVCHRVEAQRYWLHRF